MMKKKQVYVIVLVIGLLVSGVCYSCSFRRGDQDNVIHSLRDDSESQKLPLVELSEEESIATVTSEDDNETMIYVHICGAVMESNVYQVKDGTRLVELIELAGGLSSEAAGDYINQASVVEDGQRIYIPTKKEIEENEELALFQEESSASKTTGLVNLNKADAEELMSLPGIGKAKASSIIEYRDNNGKFTVIEDLMKVPGIKEGLYSQVADRITVK